MKSVNNILQETSYIIYNETGCDPDLAFATAYKLHKYYKNLVLSLNARSN